MFEKKMFEKKKVYIVHESRKSYEKRKKNKFMYGLLAVILFIYLAMNFFKFFIIMAVVCLIMVILWKKLTGNPKGKSIDG